MKGESGVAATIQTFFFKVLVLTINMATGVITAQALGKIGRGELATITLWPQFLGYIFAFGIAPSLLYNLKNNSKEESELYSASLLMGGFFGLAAAITGILCIPYALTQYSSSTVLIAQLFVLTAPVAVIDLVLTAAYQSRGLFSVVNKTNYLFPLITLGMLIGLSLLNQMTPFTAALSYQMGFLIVDLWKFIDLWKYYKPKFHHLKRSFRKLWGYSWRSSGIDILSQLSERIDQVLIVGFLEPGMMGLYVVALAMSRMLIIIPVSIFTVLFPKAIARSLEEITLLAGQGARISTLITFTTAIPLMTLGPLILPYMYGPDFVSAVPVFSILCIEMVIKGAILVLSQAFMASGRPGIVTMLQATGLALSVPLMIVFIPRFGLIGTGLALLCSSTVRLVFILTCFPLVLKVPPPNLLPNRKDLVYLFNILMEQNKENLTR